MLKDSINSKHEVTLGLTRTMPKEMRRRIDRDPENYEQEIRHRASADVCQLQEKLSVQMLLNGTNVCGL